MFESIGTKHYKLDKWDKNKKLSLIQYSITFKRKRFLWNPTIFVKISEVEEGHHVSVRTTHKDKITINETHEILKQLEEFFTKKHITRMHYLSGAKWNVTNILFRPKPIDCIETIRD